MDAATPDAGPTLDDVLTNLLTRVADLESGLRESVGWGVYFGGMNRLYHAAVLALIQSAQKPEELEPMLRSMTDTLLDPGAMPADPRCVNGMVAAHELLTIAMRDALTMNNTEPMARH